MGGWYCEKIFILAKKEETENFKTKLDLFRQILVKSINKNCFFKIFSASFLE